MALATAVTLTEWVSRLCTTCPAAPWEMTWVTAASREKYGENLIRSRSARNSSSADRHCAANGSLRRASRRSTASEPTACLSQGGRARRRQ